MHRWPKSAPCPAGPWTVTDGEGYGLLDPENGVVTPIDPATDRRLPGIAASLATGAQMIAYRHQRRAVTRNTRSFTKIVRPDRASTIVDNHQMLAGAHGFEIPQILDVLDDGRVHIEAIGGPTLHDRLRIGGDVPLCEIATAMAALHAASKSPNNLPAATIDDPTRWITIATRMDPTLRDRLQAVADTLPKVDPTGTALVHTDLHDKNVMLTERSVHFIDLDGLAAGAPEIDVVNLGVHLELRALQAGHDRARGRRHFDELLIAYDTQRSLSSTVVEAIERHTWFRLACLYLCRPSGHRLAGAMLQRATTTAAICR
jgi:tRNA A-37 threonylcarbamoyl transferase component Bud32